MWEEGEEAPATEAYRSRYQNRRRRNPPRDFSSLTIEEHRKRAHDIVMRQLAMADRSREQVQTALAQREVPNDIAQETLDRFEEAGLIDDEAFARAFTHSRLEYKRTSRRAIAVDLQRKGVSRALAEEAVSEISEEEELSNAVALAQKKLAQASGNPATLRQRTYAMLARRGFSPSICAMALAKARENLTRDEEYEAGSGYSPWARLSDDV